MVSAAAVELATKDKFLPWRKGLIGPKLLPLCVEFMVVYAILRQRGFGDTLAGVHDASYQGCCAG